MLSSIMRVFLISLLFIFIYTNAEYSRVDFSSSAEGLGYNDNYSPIAGFKPSHWPEYTRMEVNPPPVRKVNQPSDNVNDMFYKRLAEYKYNKILN